MVTRESEERLLVIVRESIQNLMDLRGGEPRTITDAEVGRLMDFISEGDMGRKSKPKPKRKRK